MPIKWTPEKDQLLLLKILETHELKVNTSKVAEAWPAEDKPTPRAITERLVRMRQMVRTTSEKGGERHFSIGSGATSTPRKSRTLPSAASATGYAKRKRSDTSKNERTSPLKAKINVDEDCDGEYDLDTDSVLADTPRKKLFDTPLFSAPASPRMYHVQDQTSPLVGSSLSFMKGDETVGDGRPAKWHPAARSRRATVQLGMVNYEDSVSDDDNLFGACEDYVESSASDYVPDVVGFKDDETA